MNIKFSTLTTGEPCSTYNNLRGVCVQFQNCVSLIQHYQMTQDQNSLVVSQRNCGNRRIGRNPLLCCSDGVQQNSFRPGQQTRPTAAPTTTTTTTTTTPAPPPPPPQPSYTDCSSPRGTDGYCIRKFLLPRKQSRSSEIKFSCFWCYSRREAMSTDLRSLFKAKEWSWIC